MSQETEKIFNSMEKTLQVAKKICYILLWISLVLLTGIGIILKNESIILNVIRIPAFVKDSSYICFFILLYTLSILCMIEIVLLIKNKYKTLIHKWHIVVCIGSIVIIYLTLAIFHVMFPNIFVSDKQVYKQINKEQSVLYAEYQPVLKYLTDYKKEHGVYPQNIENVTPESKFFGKCEYNLFPKENGYILKVYPKKGVIKYYYNDEFDNGYNTLFGTGYISSFLVDKYFYEIDDNWHAVMYR